MKRKLCANMLVNPIGFGGIPIQRISKEEAKKVLEAALDNGINFIDTARVYTDSEEKIGQIAGRKKEFFIATKALVTTKKEMEGEIKKSISALRLPYIDLYQIHNIGDNERLSSILKTDGAYYALKEAKEAGLIHHIGVTAHKKEIAEKLIETGKFETIQIPFNFIERQHEKIIAKANELGIGTIIMKPLAGGAFENSEAALKWLLEQKISVIIPGMEKVEEVKQNASLLGKKLSAGELKKLEEEAKKIGKKVCRRCGYCLRHCPHSIEIPTILIFHAYFKRYGMHDWAISRYRDKVIVKADKCIECGACETACPYQLPIRKMLKEAHKDLKE